MSVLERLQKPFMAKVRKLQVSSHVYWLDSVEGVLDLEEGGRSSRRHGSRARVRVLKPIHIRRRQVKRFRCVADHSVRAPSTVYFGTTLTTTSRYIGGTRTVSDLRIRRHSHDQF